MLYRALRATAAVALRWYYAEVVVQGRERVPLDDPLLLIANHPNALIDALLVGTVVSRRVMLTAKATLFESPLLASLLSWVGVVPHRRAKDEVSPGGESLPTAAMRERNREAFRLVTSALLERRAILVFPEGISHDDPTIAVLKSGAARMALLAHGDGAVKLKLLPIGLVYEQKERPGSRVLVRVGEPLVLDDWISRVDAPSAGTLTAELESRLRAVTLNFATADRAARALELARSLVAISSTPLPLESPGALDEEADVARRVDAATTALAGASVDVIARADAFVGRLHAVEQMLKRRGVALADVRISPRLPSGLRFILREAVWAIITSVVAVLGGWTHWIPLTLARRSALHSLQADPSRDQPAMRTILLGIVCVVIWYALVASLIAHWFGWAWAAFGLGLLFTAAHAHRALQGRSGRVFRRARSYIALRRDPGFRSRVLLELDHLLAEAFALERALVDDCGAAAAP